MFAFLEYEGDSALRLKINIAEGNKNSGDEVYANCLARLAFRRRILTMDYPASC